MIVMLVLMVYFRLDPGEFAGVHAVLAGRVLLAAGLASVSGWGQQVVEDRLADHADQSVAGGMMIPTAAMTWSPAVTRATVKLMRSGRAPGQVSTASAAIRMIVW
jgi:hypothetical protein